MRSVIPWTEADEAEQRSKIIIPEAIKKANTPLATYGPIVQIGDGARSDWEEGQLVLFGKFSGTDFTMQNEDFRLIHEDEILAVLDVDLETFGALPVKEE